MPNKIILAILFMLALVLTAATTTAAATPSPVPMATVAASPSSNQKDELAINETTAKLRERLQKILGDQDDTSDNTPEKAAYIGEVTRISDEAITLKTLVGTQIIPLDSSIILLKRTQRILISDVTVGNWVIVIGNREKNRSIRPEILMVQSTNLKPREHLATIGVVSETKGSTISLIPRGKTEPLMFSVTTNSKLIDAGGEKITLKTLPKDVTVVAVGFATDKGWELGTLKTTMTMAEYKSSATPTPKPTYVPRKATPKPTVSPTPTPAN